MSTLVVFEIMARGAASGMVFVLGLAFMRLWRTSQVARLCSLFCFATSAYALVSSNTIAAILGPFDQILSILAIYNAAFFWWFVIALFCDEFEWRWWHFLPLPLITVFSLLHFQLPEGSTLSLIGMSLWHGIVALMMFHAALFGLTGLGDDLVGPRRRFRVAFAALAGLLGVSISIVEVLYMKAELPQLVFLLHGVALAVLAGVFTVWAVQANERVIPMDGGPTRDTTPPDYSDTAIQHRALAQALEAAMARKLYRAPNLTITALAEHLGTPEHRLRRLINQDLGYRNFSSFLNVYRLKDAQEILSDPDHAQDQVLLIALDLGYGSVTPFNRAFKSATGLTPTEYRKKALSTG